jgi:hypothetical protein
MDIQESRITILDFVAELAFHTASSASYKCERHAASLCANRQIGWVDVHWPCEDHISVRLKIAMPEEYHFPEKLEAIRRCMFRGPGIPEGETWEVECFDRQSIVGMDQPVNRGGFTDRMECG